MDPERLDTLGISIRLRAKRNTDLERCLRYMKFLELDTADEITSLIECKFLAIALKHDKDEARGRYAAYETIGRLEGMIQYIREAYQIASPVLGQMTIPTTPPESAVTSTTSSPQNEQNSVENVKTAARIARLDQRMAMNRRMFGD